jgi:zinc protease
MNKFTLNTCKLFIIVGSLLIASCKASNASTQTWQTDNGVKVLFNQTTQIPMLDVRVIFAAGSSRDGDKYGLANLTANALEEGAGQLSANQIADAFANVGAQYSASADQDMAVFALRSLTNAQYLEPAIQTFHTVVTQPTFPVDNITRLEKQQLIAIQMAMQDPATVAQTKFLQAIYGTSPYGHLPMGNADSVSSISQVDMQNFYKQYYVAKNALIVIVGNIDRTQAKKLANEVSQGLASGQAATPIAPTKFTAAGKTIKVAFNSEQTTILIGQPGIAVGNPRYYALALGNYTLGGGSLVTRLFTQVRSQAGLAYSISSGFYSQQAPGPFMVMAQTRNTQANAARQKIQQVLQNYIQTGPTQAELDAAKQNLIGGFPLLIAGNSNMADILTVIGFYHLPLNYLDTYRKKLQDIDLSQVQRSLNQTLQPSSMVTVMVGGAAS